MRADVAGSPCWSPLWIDGEFDPDPCSAGRVVARAHLPVVGAGDGGHNGQSQTGPAIGSSAGGIGALETLEGALQLSGSGRWVGSRLHFNGAATAAPGREEALANLLNIIGRRSGARSIISIG
mgnify:CR=1 FL=1